MREANQPSHFAPVPASVAAFIILCCLIIHLITIVQLTESGAMHSELFQVKPHYRVFDKKQKKPTQPAPAPSPVPTAAPIIYQDHSKSVCEFRKYSSKSYVKWSPKPSSNDNETTRQPSSSLINSDYLFGEWPSLLQTESTPRKLCLDRREWYNYYYIPDPEENESYNTRPFMDVISPGIVARSRLDLWDDTWWIGSNTTYIAALTRPSRHCNTTTKPSQVVTVIQLLDASFQLLVQVTLTMERNAAWGSLPIGELYSESLEGDAGFAYYFPHARPALQDAQLFVYNQQLWISYRADGFQPSNQVLMNRIHMDFDQIYPNGKWTTKLLSSFKASETVSVCCGPNKGLLVDAPVVPPVEWRRSEFQGNKSLLALTHVVPLTVVTAIAAPKTPIDKKEKVRRLTQEATTTALPAVVVEPPRTESKSLPYSLADTSALLIHLPDQQEYLGVGRIVRLSNSTRSLLRGSDDYGIKDSVIATHYFFSLSDQEPYSLTHLSSEFALPAAGMSQQKQKRHSAERIQQVTSVEIVETDAKTTNSTSSDDHRKVILAYSIQNCESAITTLSWATVKSLLRPVPPFENGTAHQVTDFMARLR